MPFYNRAHTDTHDGDWLQRGGSATAAYPVAAASEEGAPAHGGLNDHEAHYNSMPLEFSGLNFLDETGEVSEDAKPQVPPAIVSAELH